MTSCTRKHDRSYKPAHTVIQAYTYGHKRLHVRTYSPSRLYVFFYMSEHAVDKRAQKNRISDVMRTPRINDLSALCLCNLPAS